MFKNDYNNQIQDIKPDKYIKDKILNNIKKDKKPKMTKSIYKVSLSIAATFLLVCSSLFVLNRNNYFVKKDYNYNNSAIIKIENYSQIYNQIEKFKPKFSFNFGGGNKLTDNLETAPTEDAENSANKSQDQTSDTDTSDDDEFSKTDTQVDGVDEADIVKTDGKYIYSLSDSTKKINVFKVEKESLTQLDSIKLNDDNLNQDMYLYKNRLVIIGLNEQDTIINIFDVSNPKKIKELNSCTQKGNYHTSRLINNKLYLITNYYINFKNIKKNNPESFVPSIKCNNYNGTVSADSINISISKNNPFYITVSCFEITNSCLISTQSVLGSSSTVYCNTKNIIITSVAYTQSNNNAKEIPILNSTTTNIIKFKINDGNIEYFANGKIDGELLNQFSIDENKNYFRFVTTDYSKNKQTNALYILNDKLEKVSEITDLAPNERVYSVRFMGDIVYFVTFRNVDPLFSVDLSNPESPKVLSYLKIPGFSNFLYPFGDGKLLGIGQDADEKTGETENIKLSMFDINDPSNVTEFDKLTTNYDFSEALYNHKASVVDKNKGLIGFAVYNYNLTQKYVIIKFENGKFTEKYSTNINGTINECRGIYINNNFYIIDQNEIIILDIENFKEKEKIIIKP